MNLPALSFDSITFPLRIFSDASIDSLLVSQDEMIRQYFETGNDGLFSQNAMFQQDHSIEKSIEQLAQRDDVTAITINKPLLDIMPDVQSYVEVDGVNIKEVFAKLQHIDIITSKSDEVRKQMQNIAKNMIAKRKGLNGEILMRIKDETNNIIFYMEKEAKNDAVKSLIMLSDGKEQGVLIRLTGIFKTEDIKRIIMNYQENNTQKRK
jgi:hypothetical protein